MFTRFISRIPFCMLALLTYIHAAAKDDITVKGKVVEATGFHSPIPFASIQVRSAADSTLISIFSADEYYYKTYNKNSNNNKKEYTGGFSIDLPRGNKYIFSISSIGYDPHVVDVDLTTLGKREYVLDLNLISLKPVSQMLDEVTVKASKVKFYHKGDTLVYNADAFILAEGSMLDALIQQMPGVELKDDGSIFVDGRYVEELLLNGKRFFNNNKQLMMENIAAYTVKGIQVYDKQGQASELAGVDLGDSQYVMDVKLKKEYMVGTALNVEGGYGSEERYLGRLFALAFTPTGQYAAYFNTNNLNESRKPGQESSWSPDKMPTGVRKTISGGFDYNIKTANQRWELSGNVNAGSTRETDGTDMVRNNYLVENSTYDYLFNQTSNKSVTVDTKHKIYYKTDKGYGISTEPFFNYRKWDYYSEDVNATFDEAFNDVSSDFIRSIYEGNSNAALAALVNRNITMDRRKGHSIATGTNLWQGIRLSGTGDMLTIKLAGQYNNTRDERFNHYDINFGQDATPAETADRYFKNYPDFGSSLSAEVGYSRVLMRGMILSLSYGYTHEYKKETSDLFNLTAVDSWDDFMLGKLPSAIDYESSKDWGNSYLSRTTENNHCFTLNYAYRIGNYYIEYRLPVILSAQKFKYQRGQVDTTFTRTSTVFDIGHAMFEYNRKDKNRITWNWSLKNRKPDLVSMIDFVDDVDPLNIKRGNAGLKNALQFNSSLGYRFSNREKLSIWAIKWDYSLISNALSQGYIYDSQTGIRQSSYYNVNGNWSMNGSLSYAKMVGRSLMISNNLNAGHATNVDLVGQDSPQLFRSKVYDFSLTDEFRMEYRFGRHQLGLSAIPRYNRFTSNRTDFTNQNTWTVQSGLNAVFELPANFQLATDFTVYNRRGYTDEALNTDNFVWNARLTYRALKGKLLLMLDGYDILHDLSNVSYTINAQARTEVYRTVLPRYVMFHVQWRFNSQPKGKK